MKKVLCIFMFIFVLFMQFSCTTTNEFDKTKPFNPEGVYPGDSNKDEPSAEIDPDIPVDPEHPGEGTKPSDKTPSVESTGPGVVETPVQPSTENYTISYVSGTPNAYEIIDDTIYFSNVSSDSVYSLTGEFEGNIIVDINADYKLDLEFNNFIIYSSSINPIIVLSGKEFQITAKSNTVNNIYDYREKVDSNDDTIYSSCIYSLVDLELAGKGKLDVYSQNNNGVHTKDDLKVKNLSLTVVCMDNALKGNDSITIESGNIKLVAKAGDGIKTTNSHINDNQNQKGTITILAANVDIYAACDGIDASYDVVISDEGAVINIYTDKYSGYSDVETEVENEGFYYIRYSNNTYKYSIRYYNSETRLEQWENSVYHSSVSKYHYHKINKPAGFDKFDLYVYTSSQTQGQTNSYSKVYKALSINNSYDTIAISSKSGCSWTSYSAGTQSGPGGFPGGFDEGNKDKGEYSTKGIKADNQITISAGTIKINSYDDSIHANNEAILENGKIPLGNVVISGGTLTLYSNDDGIHGDGSVMISAGIVNVTNSYEGVEGNKVTISGGSVGIVSKDDGINATQTSGTTITLSGGNVYIYAGGDGIDSNSQASYAGISFNGSNAVVISISSGNSAIDSERGYSYTSGRVVAVMPSGGMSSEATKCSNFTSIGTKSNVSLSNTSFLNVKVSSDIIFVVKMPTSISNALVIYLGSSSASLSSSASTTSTLDGNGVYWK